MPEHYVLFHLPALMQIKYIYSELRQDDFDHEIDKL